MKALVTGGAGFIGHHLVDTLLERGHEVTVIDNFATGHRSRLARAGNRITLVEGDIRDAGALDRSMRGCDVVFHEAALPSVARSLRDPRESNDVSTAGTIEVMLAAGRAGVRRVIFAGSSAVYGDSPDLPRRESQAPKPLSPYAAGKLGAESYVHSLGALKGVESVVLRYFNVFGPGQDAKADYAAVVPRFVMAALGNRQPIIYGDGRQSRDFTFIQNVVSANLLAATVPGATGATCNIGCGKSFSLLDLLDAIGSTVGREVTPRFEPARAGDVPRSEADISHAADVLGYSVVVPFEEGIRRTVAAYHEACDGAA